MKTLVLGDDGYCGWPTFLHLSDVGHEVVIVDNCVRRQIDHELSASSLTPIADLKERVKAWHEVSGKEIGVQFGDLLDWEFVTEIFERHRPDVVLPSVTWRTGQRIVREHAASPAESPAL